MIPEPSLMARLLPLFNAYWCCSFSVAILLTADIDKLILQ